MHKRTHHGRNIKRLREHLGVKQEALAYKLGDDWSQRKVSLLEDKEVIEDNILQQVAEAMGIGMDAIKNYNEAQMVFNIQHNHEGANPNVSIVKNAGDVNHCSFNPLDKYVEAMDEIKRLYEALLASEREKVAMLQRIIEDQKK